MQTSEPTSNGYQGVDYTVMSYWLGTILEILLIRAAECVITACLNRFLGYNKGACQILVLPHDEL